MNQVTFQYTQELKNKSRDLRQKQTDAERFLWKRLRNRQVLDCKFYRQFALGNYILDFYCLEKKLAIELDGSQHLVDSQVLYDQKRKDYLLKYGVKILRFLDNEVFQNTDGVLQTVYDSLKG